MAEGKKLRIVFFGTPEFAVESLDSIVKAGHEVAAVVTATDKPAGRGHGMLQSDVKKYAVTHGLPLMQPAKLKDPEFLESLSDIGADLFVVIAFRMLPEAVWNMPPMGTVNVHAALLPDYRGAAPINWAIINGEKLTGVTTFLLKHDIDTGDIIMSREAKIEDDETVGSLYDRLMHLGAELIVDTLDAMSEGRINPTPQKEGNYHDAPKITKETCRIDWSKDDVDIHNLVRGLSPYPAAWTTIMLEGGETTAKILSTKLTNITSDEASGTVIRERKRLLTATGNGRCIEITELQPAGKKRMEASAFLAGYNPVLLK